MSVKPAATFANAALVTVPINLGASICEFAVIVENLPTSPTGLPTGSVWVSGSRNDASTSDVNCGTLMIVIKWE